MAEAAACPRSDLPMPAAWAEFAPANALVGRRPQAAAPVQHHGHHMVAIETHPRPLTQTIPASDDTGPIRPPFRWGSHGRSSRHIAVGRQHHRPRMVRTFQKDECAHPGSAQFLKLHLQTRFHLCGDRLDDPAIAGTRQGAVSFPPTPYHVAVEIDGPGVADT